MTKEGTEVIGYDRRRAVKKESGRPMTRVRSDDVAIREFVRHLVKKSGKTPSRLAVESGLADTTITRYLNSRNAKHTLSLRSLSMICRRVGVDNPFDVSPREVPVLGTVGAQGDVSLAPSGRPTRLTAPAPPGIDPDECWALEITDGAPFPPLSEGTILFARRAAAADHEPADPRRLYICKLTRDDLYLLRHVEPGYVPGTFNLRAPYGGVTQNVAVEWIAPVLWYQAP